MIRTVWALAVALAWYPPARALPPPKVIAAVRLPFTSSSPPAVADVDGDGRPEIAVTVDHIGDKTRSPDDPKNLNAVHLYSWRDGGLRLKEGWPHRTPDAVLGLTMADLDGDGTREVLAACGQDNALDLMERAGLWLTSRLYVWRADGSPFPPWSSPNPDSLVGRLYGHAYAAPVAVDLDGDGTLEILHASQGAWTDGGFARGGLRVWSARGTVVGQTQGRDPALPWHATSGFALDAPPVIADLRGDGRPCVVAASWNGTVSAWDAQGRPIPGWLPAKGAFTRSANEARFRWPPAAVDINGDGRDDILAAAEDGALYAWDSSGRLLFRSPAAGNAPVSLASGVSVGRLRPGHPVPWIAVAGGSDGYVTAWKPDGGILWRARTTPGRPVVAEPVIGDVNGDGRQDVVVGGTDGYVHAFDGTTGDRLWRVPTFWAPTAEGMRLEAVMGAPALADLRGNGHLCVIVATAQRAIADIPARSWQGFGHLMVLDCGPGTWSSERVDWPQYRQNAARTGRAVQPGP